MLKTMNSERPGTNGGPKRRARDMCNKFSAARILHLCLPYFTGSPRNSFGQTRELTSNRVVLDLPSLCVADAKAPSVSSAIGGLISQTTSVPPQKRLKRSHAVGVASETGSGNAVGQTPRTAQINSLHVTSLTQVLNMLVLQRGGFDDVKTAKSRG